MTLKILEPIRRFQEYFLELGVARAILALPAPRMLTLSSPTSQEAEPANVFGATVTEPEIETVARDLFASGHYSLAVQEAYKAGEKYIESRAGHLKVSGTQLMEIVFNPNDPILSWTERKTTSEQDEQKGYQRLYAGAMLRIRNPVIHEFDWVDDLDRALELLVFAQHLLRRAKSAQLVVQPTQAAANGR